VLEIPFQTRTRKCAKWPYANQARRADRGHSNIIPAGYRLIGGSTTRYFVTPSRRHSGRTFRPYRGGMPARAAARCDAAFVFAYRAVPHSWHNGRDHGHFLSKGDNRGHRLSKDRSARVRSKGSVCTALCHTAQESRSAAVLLGGGARVSLTMPESSLWPVSFGRFLFFFRTNTGFIIPASDSVRRLADEEGCPVR